MSSAKSEQEQWWQPDGSFECPQGKLSRKEVDKAVQQFYIFDSDGDGLVSFDDFVTTMVRKDGTYAHPSKRLQLEQMYMVCFLRATHGATAHMLPGTHTPAVVRLIRAPIAVRRAISMATGGLIYSTSLSCGSEISRVQLVAAEEYQVHQVV